MKKKKAAHTEEFKETAIRLALAGDKSTAEVARELGLPEWKLYGWVQSWRKRHAQGDAKASPASEQLAKLQKENKRLKEENEILKKAAAYFAKTLL
jgi:transposase